MKKNKMILVHLLCLFTSIVWGTTFISTKVLLENLHPMKIMLIRFTICYLLLWVVYPRIEKTKSWKDEALFAVTGFSGITLYYLFENMALMHTFASNASIIISVAPMFTVIFACFIYKNEKPGKNFFFGFAVAMAGIILVELNGSLVMHMSPFGDFLALLAAATYGIYAIFYKKLSDRGYNCIAATRRTHFYGILFLLPFLWKEGYGMETELLKQPVILGNLLYLGVIASAVCYLCWNYAIEVLGAVKTGVYIYILPAITMLTSALILKEPMSWLAVLGCVLCIMGLVVSEKN
ncbi:DMT family transporter [Acetivibrio ethanolgignens]|nr:DMT family transporter [Acetivibrio ethanolgignens]